MNSPGTVTVIDGATPILLSPSNGSTTAPRNPTLAWNSCAYATKYEIQISTSSTFSTVMDTVVSGSSRKAPLLSATTTYYWRVNAGNSTGTSDWSAVWSFKTTNAGVLDGKPQYTGAALGYSGILAVYSIDGRRVMQLSFDASATKEHLLKDALKTLAKGVYTYRLNNNGKIMDEANIVAQ
jgi:hypothetical protein